MAFLKNKRRVLGGMVFAPFKFWQVLGKKGIVLSGGKWGEIDGKSREGEAAGKGKQEFTPLCGSGGQVTGSDGRVMGSGGRLTGWANHLKTSWHDFTPSGVSLTG